MDPVTLHSTRFGTIEVPREAILDFPGGLIGLSGTRYALLAHGEDSTFLWLHSLDDPALAVMVTNPWHFFDAYEVELGVAETDRLGLTDTEETSVFVTVRDADSAADCSANLQAPILIAGGRGHQVINQAADAPVRAAFDAHRAEALAA